MPKRSFPPRSMNRLITFAFFILCIAACDSSDNTPNFPEGLVVFEVEVAEQETFRIALSSDAAITEAEQALNAGRVGVIIGDLAEGDGGFNTSYTWHLAPETVEFVDLAVEVCDGRPRSDVEKDLDYWINTVGTYCPWGAKVVRRLN